MPAGSAGGQFRIYFRNHLVEPSQLQEELTKLPSSPTPMVAVLVDRRAPYELVARVLSMVGNTGISCFLPVMPPGNQPERRFEK